MLKQRLIFGSILIAVLVAIFALDHFTHTVYGFSAVLLLVNAVALYEFYTMHETKIQAKLPKHYAMIIGLMILSIPIAGNLITSSFASPKWMFVPYLLTIFVALSIPILMAWYVQKGNPVLIQNIYIILFGLLYICFPLFLIYSLRVAESGKFNGETFFYFFIILNKTADTAAYFGGSLLGRHKLAPLISPKKTIEGLICAIIIGLVIGQIFWSFTSLGNSFNYLPFIILTFFMTLGGQIGDLFESMIKRYCGVKDSFVLFPALGGVLDLIDCLLSSAFVAAIMLTIMRI